MPPFLVKMYWLLLTPVAGNITFLTPTTLHTSTLTLNLCLSKRFTSKTQTFPLVIKSLPALWDAQFQMFFSVFSFFCQTCQQVFVVMVPLCVGIVDIKYGPRLSGCWASWVSPEKKYWCRHGLNIWNYKWKIVRFFGTVLPTNSISHGTVIHYIAVIYWDL